MPAAAAVTEVAIRQYTLNSVVNHASQMEEMEAVVEAQRRAVDAAARTANDARDSQSTTVQELQLTLQK
jgi:hypothetical protein